MRDYFQKLKSANDNYEKYWEEKFQQFKWFKPYSKVLDNSDPNFPKWFVDGELNLSYECLDKNVEDGHGDETAFILESFYTNESGKITYKELLDKVSKLSGFMHSKGLRKNDRVVIFLPTALETVICMLATIRLGAVYTVLYGGFSDEAIADRLDDFRPKILVTANDDFALNHSTPMKVLVDKAIEIAKHKPSYCLVWQRPNFQQCKMIEGRDIDLHEAIDSGEPHSFVPIEANQLFYIIYTSGTTGKPKGIAHCARGVLASVIQDEGFMLRPDFDNNIDVPQVLWITSNFAWIAGQFAGCYSPLILRIPSILYEGAVKDMQPEDVYRVLANHKVTVTFISTQSVRGLMALDPHGNKAEAFKPFNVKMSICGGVAGDGPTLNWIKKALDAPIVQVYGQTEIGGIVTTFDYEGGEFEYSMLSVGKPIPGINLKIMRDDGTEATKGEAGKVMLKLPLPPVMMLTILNNDQLFVKDLLNTVEGFYDLKDDGKLDAEGNLYVLCRSDSVFKVGGHRISCTGIEEVMMSHPDIAECIVVTKPVTKNGITNQIPEGFFATKMGTVKSNEEIAIELVALVHKQIGSFVPFAPPRRVTEFPKTVSGKLSRSSIEQVVRNPEKITTLINSDPCIKSLCDAVRDIRG